MSPAEEGATTVFEWPPRRAFFSNTVTSWRRLRSQAADMPAMPEPITAMRWRFRIGDVVVNGIERPRMCRRSNRRRFGSNYAAAQRTDQGERIRGRIRSVFD